MFHDHVYVLYLEFEAFYAHIWAELGILPVPKVLKKLKSKSVQLLTVSASETSCPECSLLLSQGQVTSFSLHIAAVSWKPRSHGIARY